MTSFLLAAGVLTALSLLLLLARRRPRSVDGAPESMRPSRGLALVLATGVLVIVGGGYAWVGSPSLLPVTPHAFAAGAPTEEATAAGDAVAQTLHREADAHRDDAQLQFNWARAELDRGNARAAAEGYRRAIALRPRDADLLADAADVLASAADGQLSGEPMQLADRALAIDPNQLKALALKGAEALQRRDYPTALAAWGHALKIAPPNDPIATYLRRQLEAMRAAAGLPPAAPSAAPGPDTGASSAG